MKRLTLASVAARLRCAACFTGPDEVHLTATIHGLELPKFGGDAVWSIPLRCRERRPSYHHRRRPGAPHDGCQARRRAAGRFRLTRLESCGLSVTT